MPIDDAEITLTTVLAYVSYLVAEEVLHASGVMATIAAGLTIGGWGRMKISYAVRDYLEHFWTYLAFLANALIFSWWACVWTSQPCGPPWACWVGWWWHCWCRALP
jgi:NhaP-type Na+/H+ or K+/H+ antiporter